MMKTIILIGGLTFFGPNTGGINVEIPFESLSLNISHLELCIGADGPDIHIEKDGTSALSLKLKSGKTIHVRF